MQIPVTRYHALRFSWILTQRGQAHADSLRRLRFALEEMACELGFPSPLTERDFSPTLKRSGLPPGRGERGCEGDERDPQPASCSPQTEGSAMTGQRDQTERSPHPNPLSSNG